jgi:hypothetical protein
MDTTRPARGSGRRSTVVLLAGILSFAVFLTAGCAGNRSGGQVAAGGVASTTTETTGQPGTTTATTKKATSRTTADTGSVSTSRSISGVTPTTRRRPTATTASRPTTKPTTTSKPTVTKVKLTLAIVNTGNVDGAVVVSPGGTCGSTCTFTFTKGTSVALSATDDTIEAHLEWKISGGSTTCGQGSCDLGELNVDTTVQAIFGSKEGGG